MAAVEVQDCSRSRPWKVSGPGAQAPVVAQVQLLERLQVAEGARVDGREVVGEEPQGEQAGPEGAGRSALMRLFCKKRRCAGRQACGTAEKLLAWQLTVGGAG